MSQGFQFIAKKFQPDWPGTGEGENIQYAAAERELTFLSYLRFRFVTLFFKPLHQVERVGIVSRMLLPTDGLWRGAMHAFQDPSALRTFDDPAASAFPFLSDATLSAVYLAWVLLWVVMIGGP